MLLRDPMERTVSQVFHAKRNGYEPLELEEALSAEAHRLASSDPFRLQKLCGPQSLPRAAGSL